MHQIDMKVSATLTKKCQKLLPDQEGHRDHDGPVSVASSQHREVYTVQTRLPPRS